jgi:hypothetical protein
VKPKKETFFGNMSSDCFGTFLFFTFPSCDWLNQVCTNFPQIYEPFQNSRHEMGDVRQVRHSDVAPGIRATLGCTPLNSSI